MRILLAQKFDRDPSAGHAGKRLRLAAELARLGAEVETFFGDDAPPALRKLRTRTFAWRLLGRARRGGYDLVDVTAGASWLLGLFPRRFALVESVYGAEHLYYRRWQEEVAKGGYRCVVPRFRPWYPYLQIPLVARAWRNADHLVCEAGDNRDFLVAEGFAPAGKVSVVSSGVDEALFRLPREPRPVRRLLFVSGWMMMKGVRYLAEAFGRLAESFPDATLTVVGGHLPGDEPAECFSEPTRGRVRVLGRVERGQMPGIYAEHDALLFPSLSEGFANVVLEAMAAGLPVVATPVGCARDLIRDGENGFLVPPADSAALAGAAERLIRDPELAGRLGAAARETARAHSWEAETRRLLGVYERLVAGRAARGRSSPG